MPAFVPSPGRARCAAAAGSSPAIPHYPRNPRGFDGLVVTDAFIMGGATATAPEAQASVAAVNAGCDMLLYPTDWAGVARALERVDSLRTEEALARYEKALTGAAAWPRGQGASTLDDAELVEHQRFADELADRTVHLV